MHLHVGEKTFDAHLLAIERVHRELAARDEAWEFMPPTPISHVREYASDRKRLWRYADKIIGARIEQFRESSYLKTWFFLDLYLYGRASGNPFALPFAARAQLETYAYVHDTVCIIQQNAGNQPENYLERVATVDNELIRAMHGTRSERMLDIVATVGARDVRPLLGDGRETEAVRNIRSRMEKASKTSPYREIVSDYEHVSAYVHSSYQQDEILMVPSATGDGRFSRLSRTHNLPLEALTRATARAMAIAARSTIDEFANLDPPFPASEV